MPRVSRRKKKQDTAARETAQMKYYRTCIYVRLSRKDGGHGRKDSIYIQKQVCMDFVKRHPEMLVSKIYEDNGVTGTTFEREEFEQLMEEVRAGKVDCIIVKDFARFGRDALDAVDLVDVVFPSLDVRFVSVLDDYDSENPACVQDRVSNILKHFMNDYYAREVSAKLVQAHRQSREKGEYWGARPPYGYRWPEGTKKMLVPDDGEKKTVQQIFYWYVFEDMSSYDIARELNAMEVPSPAESHGLRQSGEVKAAKRIYWRADRIRSIVQNPLYTGAAVYGKTKQMLCDNIPLTLVPRGQWEIHEDVWEPLVEKSVFEEAQKIAKERWKDALQTWAANPNVEPAADGPFLGRIYCGNCGGKLQRQRCGNEKYAYRVYKCMMAVDAGKAGCQKRLNERRVLEAVGAAFQYQVQLAAENGKRYGMDFYKRLEKESSLMVRKAEERYEKAGAKLEQLFEHYATGILDREEYVAFKEEYRREQEKAHAALADTQNHFQGLLDRLRAKIDWTEELVKCRGNTEISREIVERFIEKVVVKSADEIEVRFWFGDIFEENPAEGLPDMGGAAYEV